MMISDLHRLWLGLKNMRLWFWTPFIALYLLLPSLQMSIQHASLTIERSKLRFFAEAQTFIPILGTIWLFLFFREYVENDIAEVLYATDHRPKLRFAAYLFLLYHIAIFPLYVWYTLSYQNAGMELLRLSFQTLVLYAAFYAILYLVRSSLFAFGFILLDSGLMIYIIPSGARFNLFALKTSADHLPADPVIFYTGLTIIFVILGLLFERSFFTKRR